MSYLLATSHRTCMTYTWCCIYSLRLLMMDGKTSETCTVMFQNKINLRYCASGWFYYRNILRCTVLQISNNENMYPFFVKRRDFILPYWWKYETGTKGQSRIFCDQVTVYAQFRLLHKASLRVTFIHFLKAFLNIQSYVVYFRVYL